VSSSPPCRCRCIWTPIALADLPLFLLIGVLGTVAQLCLIRSFSVAEASLVAPFTYCGIVFATIWGVLLYDEWPDGWTVVGALVIVGAGLYVWHRETAVRASRGHDRTPNAPLGFAQNLAVRGLIGGRLAAALPLAGAAVGWADAPDRGPLAGYRARARENLALIWPDLPERRAAAHRGCLARQCRAHLIENYSTADLLAAAADRPADRGPGFRPWRTRTARGAR
jgi:hypothetical protein